MRYDELRASKVIRYPEYLLTLDNHRLYSVYSVIEHAQATQIFGDKDDFDKAYRRLHSLFKKLGEKDGDVTSSRGSACGWYGARIKLLLPESALPREDRLAIAQALELLLDKPITNEALARRLAMMEARFDAMDQRKVNPWSALQGLFDWWRTRPRLRLWGGLGLLTTLLVVAVVAWQQISIFKPNPESPNRLAILQCAQTDAVFYSALERALDSSRHLRADILATDEIQPTEPCGKLALDRLADLSKASRTPFLTWGLAERDGNGYHYEGWLYQHEEGRRSFKVSATDRLDLADAAAHQILAMLGFENDMIQSKPLYSINPSANLLFSEGELFAKQGHFRTAVDNLGRASRFYDPKFYYGQSRLARAMIVTGEFDEAKNVLASLFDQQETPLNAHTRLSAMRSAAQILYLDFDFGELGPLLVEAKDLAAEEDPEQYLFFARLEAKMHLAQGNMAMAEATIEHYLRFAKRLADPAAPIFAMMVQAEAAVERKAYSEAFQILEKALGLAQEVGSVAEEVDVIVAIAALAIKTKTNYDFALAQLEGVEGKLFAASLADTVELKYRKGQIFLATERTEEGVDLLEQTYEIATDHGLFYLECHARIRLAEHHLSRNELFDVDYIMTPLKERILQASPGYRLRYESVMWQFYSAKGRFNDALDSLQECLTLSELVQAHSEVGRVLNEMGNTYFKLKEFEKAEAKWLEALAYKEKYWPKTSRSTILNLIMLYEMQNRNREASELKKKLDRE